MTSLSTFFDLHHQRSGLSALGLYIVLFISTAIVGGLIAGFIMLFLPGSSSYEQSFAYGLQIGMIAASLCSALLCFLVTWKKRFLPHPGMIALIFCSGALGYIGGALFGMIIPSFLTTKTPKAV